MSVSIRDTACSALSFSNSGKTGAHPLVRRSSPKSGKQLSHHPQCLRSLHANGTSSLGLAYDFGMREHPEAYPVKADFRIDAKLLRDQITSKARTVLWVLLAASGLVFIIACSNVANLILARTIRREGELAVRAALGATTALLRRVLLAESLLLCGAGAMLGVLSARPMVAILARYASRFSVRALDLMVDSSMLWIGAGLALGAAVLLAFVPPAVERSVEWNQAYPRGACD